MRHGRTVRTPAFAVKVFSALFPYSRFGVVVGRRVAKSAAHRNRIRRRAFTAIGARFAEWPVADYLIVTHPAAAAKTAQQWHDELIPSSLT